MAGRRGMLPIEHRFVPPTAIVPRPTQEDLLRDHWKRQELDQIKWRLGMLRRAHPDWFAHSDAGERPIERMLRGLQRRQFDQMLGEDRLPGPGMLGM